VVSPTVWLVKSYNGCSTGQGLVMRAELERSKMIVKEELRLGKCRRAGDKDIKPIIKLKILAYNNGMPGLL
jgi:hypothetical protein